MRTPSRRLGREGFSLAEIMIVLVIMGVVLAMALPKLTGAVGESALRGAINRLASDLTLARMQAIKNATSASVQIASDGKSYTVVIDPTGTNTTYKTVRLYNDYPSLVLSPTSSTVTFDSRGMLTTNVTKVKATRDTRADSLLITGVGRIYRAF
jgi:type II secretion system protein H